ncbi:MAG: hypothetical protein V4736_01835 [Bdellovibrionota bacterium]
MSNLSSAGVQSCNVALLRKNTQPATSIPHVSGPRSSSDYATPQSQPRKRWNEKEDAWETTDITPEIPSELLEMSSAQLLEISKDGNKRREFALEGPWRFVMYTEKHVQDFADKIQVAAAILLSRMATPNLVPGLPLTREQFKYQASLLGQKIVPVKQAFRYDVRDPNQIKKVGGFFPNPSKQPFTLWENVSKHVDGGANFVSGTLLESNAHVVLSLGKRDQIALEKGTAERLEAPVRELLQDAMVEYGIEGQASDPQRVKAFSYKLYEYSVSNHEGVFPPDFATIENEKEVVFRTVPIGKINKYRVVYAVEVLTLNENGEIQFRRPKILEGPWQSM